MKFFVDTAEIDDIKDLAATGMVDGVTTNPSLIMKSGRDIIEVTKEICDIVDGPVSAEVAATEADAMIAEGVATVEIKSGYGLDIETELNMLRAARRLAELRPVRVKTSFLGAHAVPAEYKGSPETYLREVCLPALDAAAEEGLADAIDGFCEGIAFDTAQIARVFDKARQLGLPVKLHAEQLSHIGGTRLAAAHGALSADHVEYADDADAAALAGAGSVAVLLPGAFYTLHETRKPPVGTIRRGGRVAEGARLESVYTVTPYRGFESLLLRHFSAQEPATL